MPKKTVKRKSSPKRKALPALKPAPKTGMWKILEMKKAQHKLNSQARSDGRMLNGPGHVFESHPRDPRFTKFAGPRRKVG